MYNIIYLGMYNIIYLGMYNIIYLGMYNCIYYTYNSYYLVFEEIITQIFCMINSLKNQ